jgi:hypothetical protein
MSSKGGSGRQIVGYRYIMALHSGISRGPVNEFNEIRVGDLEVWNGNMTVTGSDTINCPRSLWRRRERRRDRRDVQVVYGRSRSSNRLDYYRQYGGG